MSYPNYGQYIPKNYFKAFIMGFHLLWSDEKYWFVNPNELPWDIIKPFVGEYNAKRNKILSLWRLLIDETMSEFRPKTSETGGLPNITCEKRKPKDLGTMARNGLDTITGIFAHHDIVEDLTAQRCKRYLQSDNVSHLPQGKEIYVHVAECIRQVEGAKLKRGSWLGGDAWFDSVPCVVELMKRCGVFSTFIVKQHIQYFPKKVLHAVLLARFDERPAGHWVVMVGKILGVEVMLY